MANKLEMVYEGKAKKVYKTDDPKRFIVDYKDDATAFNGIKKGTIEDKGIMNNKISSILFGLLESKGIETHFIELLSDREMEVKAVKILPIEVITRNIAAGSICQRFGLEEGLILEKPLVELCYKNDALGDPFITEDHVEILKLATKEQITSLKESTLKINKVLKDFFLEKGIKLVDFKLEFGLYEDRVILADEISPDTCRFWNAETNEKLDKDRFRRDLGDITKGYISIMNKLTK